MPDNNPVEGTHYVATPTRIKGELYYAVPMIGEDSAPVSAGDGPVEGNCVDIFHASDPEEIGGQADDFEGLEFVVRLDRETIERLSSIAE